MPSHGNAIGVGLADYITRRLRDDIDENKTFLNAFTTGDMRRMAIPCTLKDDEEIVARLVERYGDKGWMFIPNTLHLETLYCTEDVAEKIRSTKPCQIAPSPTPLVFVMASSRFSRHRGIEAFLVLIEVSHCRASVPACLLNTGKQGCLPYNFHSAD